jgi:hypothetical protein
LFHLSERRHANARKEHGVTDGTVRVKRAAKAAAVILLTAASCSVYDSSLLGDGASGAGSGGQGSAGRSGAAGEMNGGAGHAGSAGKPTDNGGASGSSSGEGGMIDSAGAMDAGGEGPEGGGTAGASGTAGSAGNGGGTSGGGGTSDGGGTSGGGGSGGGAGTGGSPAVTGCAKLTVPMDDASDRAHFVISLTTAANLASETTGIVSMHLYVQAGAAGTIFNYVQDSGYHYFGVTTASRPALKGLIGSWQTLSFNVGLQPAGSTGINKGDIKRIGIEINAAPDTVAWSNPTVVYIDSISVMTPALSFPLDTMASVSTTPTGSDVAGQVLWQHNGSMDTTAAGVTLTWQATCP